MADVLFGVVKDNVDPEKLGRVQVTLNDHGGEVIVPWIRVLQPMATSAAGTFWIPELEDNVVILQGPGGIDGMVVIGCLYDGVRKPPGEGKPEIKQWLTAGGSEITIDDTSGSELITIQTKETKTALVLNHSEATLVVYGDSGVSIASASGPVTIDATEVTVIGSDKIVIGDGSGKVPIEGSAVEIKSSGKVAITGSAVEVG